MSEANGCVQELQPYVSSGQYVESFGPDDETGQETKTGESTVRLEATGEDPDMEWLIAEAIGKAFARLDAVGSGKDFDAVVTANPMRNWCEVSVTREFGEFADREAEIEGELDDA